MFEWTERLEFDELDGRLLASWFDLGLRFQRCGEPEVVVHALRAGLGRVRAELRRREPSRFHHLVERAVRDEVAPVGQRGAVPKQLRCKRREHRLRGAFAKTGGDPDKLTV